MKQKFSDEELKKYLLGSASNTLSEKIDLEILASDEIAETLIIAEENLIEEQLEGELNETEQSLFFKKFLTNEERRFQFRLISQLKQFSNNAQNENIRVKPVNENKSIFQRLIKPLVLQPSMSIVLILIFGLIIGLIWVNFSNTNDNLTAIDIEYAKINSQDFSDLSKFNESEHLVLINEKVRGINKSNRLQKTNLKERVFINIALRSDSAGKETFQIKVIKNNIVIFKQLKIPVFKNDFGDELRFLMPTQILEPGNYKIKVISNDDRNNNFDYSFVVE
jgi:hypothetical protein